MARKAAEKAEGDEDAREPEAGTALDFGTRLARLEQAVRLIAGAQVHEVPGLAELLAEAPTS